MEVIISYFKGNDKEKENLLLVEVQNLNKSLRKKEIEYAEIHRAAELQENLISQLREQISNHKIEVKNSIDNRMSLLLNYFSK